QLPGAVKSTGDDETLERWFHPFRRPGSSDPRIFSVRGADTGATSPPSPRGAADRARSHLRSAPKLDRDRTQGYHLLLHSVIHRDRQSQGAANDAATELRRQRRAELNRICPQDVVPVDRKASIRVEFDEPRHVTKRASDVNMGGGIRYNDAR